MISTPIYSVSQLNLEVRELLEQGFPAILITGEISNLRRPSSGHLYFSLKDEHAQVRCAMFRMRSNALAFEPKEGSQVLLRARISLYEERGEFQLIVEEMEEAGDGALRRAFELLKQRLAAEGLFDPAIKKKIPVLPRCIGVVTSSTGAAIRDILIVLKRRFSGIRVIIYPTQVQGNLAAGQITKAIQLANQRQECDVLILARGGGSLEDLWPFNDEIVARAIFASNLPIVTGIGHEIDFTIADFVADHRAATPSAAAEIVSPHQQDYQQKIDYLESRLESSQQHFIKQKQMQIEHLFLKLQCFQPQHYLQEIKTQINNLQQRLQLAIQQQLKKLKSDYMNLNRALSAVSPLNTLQRGYAIVMHGQKIVSDVNQLQLEDRIKVQLNNGKLICKVEQK